MVSAGEAAAEIRSTACDESAQVTGGSADNVGSWTEVTLPLKRSGPDSMVPACDKASKNSRHFGHDLVCKPISELSIPLVCSAIKFASCSRLGQPVTAIPPESNSACPRQRGPYPSYSLGYHVLKLKSHRDAFSIAASLHLQRPYPSTKIVVDPLRLPLYKHSMCAMSCHSKLAVARCCFRSTRCLILLSRC